MDCEQVRSEMWPLLFDGLEEDMAQRLRIHISGCKPCTTLHDELEGTLGEIEAPTDDAPEQVWTQLAQRIDEHNAHQASVDRVKVAVSCTYCKGSLARSEAAFCGSCLAPHHSACFEEHGRCSNLGCGETRLVRALEADPNSRVGAVGAPKPLEIKPRRKVWVWMTAVLGSGALAAAAFTGNGSTTATPATVTPVVKLPQEARWMLSRPVLAPLRSKAIQTLDRAIKTVTIDRDGDPWFGARDPERRRSLDEVENWIKIAKDWKSQGRQDLVLMDSFLEEHKDDGRLVFATFVSKPMPENFQGFSKARPFPLGFELPKNVEFKGQDRFGRIYASSTEGLVVFDPWAEEAAPHDTLTATEVYAGYDDAVHLAKCDEATTKKVKAFDHITAEGADFTGTFTLTHGASVCTYDFTEAGRQLTFQGPGGIEIYSAPGDSVLQTQLTRLSSGFAPARRLETAKIVAHSLSCLYFLDRGQLNRVTRDNVAVLPMDFLLDAIWPVESGLLGLIQSSKSELVLLKWNQESSRMDAKRTGLVIDKGQPIFATKNGEVLHALSKADMARCTWQGENRELSSEGEPLLSAGGLIWLWENDHLITWDGQWKKFIAFDERLTAKPRLVFDERNERVLVVSSKGKSLKIRALKLGQQKVDWQHLTATETGCLEITLKETLAINSLVVAGEHLWIGHSTNKQLAVALPPSLDHADRK